MSFGFKDMVYGTLCPIYGVYKLSTTDMKEYEQFARDAQYALYRDANGQFNPVKAASYAIPTVGPIMAMVNLWQKTGQDLPPRATEAIYQYPGSSSGGSNTPRINPSAIRPAVGAGE